MNYRHAFHAGNFADVMKHALLVRILQHLRQKPAPFRVVDTHAGIGRYDLSGPEAERSPEWQDGIDRLAEPFAPQVEALLEPYRAVLAEVRARYGGSVYPGSPAIIRELLRREDRGVFAELHPEDGAVLKERYNSVSNVKVLQLDGWTAMMSLIPPPERRGLVLIDPPYEVEGELARAAAQLARAVAKWPIGIFALWYPIKDPREIETFARSLGGLGRETLRLEIGIDRPGAERLIGSGLIVVNPPWRLAQESSILLPALAGRLARGAYASFRCDPLSEPGAPRPKR